MEKRRIAIAAGGTPGHVNLGLAIAESYRQTFEDLDLLFIGAPGGAESRLVPPRGFPLELLPGLPIMGESLAGKLRAVRQLAYAIWQARRLLRERKTRLVIGLGSYASAAPIFAAKTLRLHTAIHEANVIAGLTNRWIGSLVDRVYLGFASADLDFPKNPTVVVGNPVRPEIAKASDKNRVAPSESGRAYHLLVLAGTKGAAFLNEKAVELIRKLAEHGPAIEVRHQAADANAVSIQAEYARCGISASVVPYLDDMGEAYSWADLSLTRSGASTLAELAAVGLPALLVPLAGSAENHQEANAKFCEEANCAIWVREVDWDTDELAGRVAPLLTNDQAWRAASVAMRGLSRPDAARSVVSDCEAMMAGHW
jgi:UDP-N-acetylglucosamine--N-acetylmuramyl-(pentapeptide) pyrophosphoryl-undecaprenol N-acetylglucosamine transferase